MGAKRVYLDQNAYGRMLDADSDWQKSDIAVALNGAGSDVAEVWVSPVHVLELMLTTDETRMKRLAYLMLALAGHRRMLRSYEFEVVTWMLGALQAAVAGAVRDTSEIEFHSRHVETAFLCVLALMAHGVRPPEPTVAAVLDTKLANRLISARGMADLDAWLAALRSAVEGRPDDLLALAAAEMADRATILTEIGTLEGQRERLRPNVRGRLQKQRDTFVRAYREWSIAESFLAVFRSPLHVEVTLDLDLLMANWNSIYTKFSSRPVPRGQTEPETRGWVLRQVVRGMGDLGLLPSTIAAEVYFADWERSATDRSLPTDGLTFDMDHAAVGLCNADVFVTFDVKLRDCCEKLSTKIREAGGKAAVVAGSAKEISAALATQ